MAYHLVCFTCSKQSWLNHGSPEGEVSLAHGMPGAFPRERENYKDQGMGRGRWGQQRPWVGDCRLQHCSGVLAHSYKPDMRNTRSSLWLLRAQAMGASPPPPPHRGLMVGLKPLL